MMDINKLWWSVTEIFPIIKNDLKTSNVSNIFIIKAHDELQQLGILQDMNEILWIHLCSTVRNEIVPKFWLHFEIDTKCVHYVCNDNCHHNCNNIQYNFFEKFISAVKELQTFYDVAIIILNKVHKLKSSGISDNADVGQQIEVKKFNEMLREALLGSIPPHFNHIVYAFYNVSLKVFANVYQSKTNFSDADVPALNEVKCNGCNMEANKCQCHSLIYIINTINEKLLHMGLLDRIAGQSVTVLIQLHIKEHINNISHGIFDRSHLKLLETWLENVIVKWLTLIFNYGNVIIGENNFKIKNIIEGFRVKLTYFLYEHFAQNVIEQFFSIIIDFPDSIPAIDDLKICMEKIDMRKDLIKILKSSLEARILHPGVNTMDILTGYVAAIKAIRHLDSSGVILETVTLPIKEYLRKRSDTVRRVVTALTEEGPTDLSEELAKGETLKDNMISTVRDDLTNWENWFPDPFGIEHTSPLHYIPVSRSADVISMVVDIYGSKELFMNEYRNLMADRLLTQLDFNPEKEIRNLELLKLRFGEVLLHSCEVMLKDVADSKRINTHIQSDPNYNESKLFDISSLIISAQFWPSFNKESLELPEEIASEFNKYTKSFEAYKGNRTLNWRNVTGRVNIVVELGDRTIEMTVSPTQAVIIYHYQNKHEWTLEDLSTLIKVPPSVLRRRIGFWQTNGIILESRPGVFKLIEEEEQKTQFSEIQITDEDIESAMASTSDQREEELQVFWSYIVGMLTNLDSLPLERIHQMLKLFASHGIGVEFSQTELKDFLQRKVREHKLIFSGGVYQLAK